MKGNELIPITSKAVKDLGWETEDDVAYVLMLDDKRHIDLFCVKNEWSFQLTEEPSRHKEEAAIFSGRKIFYMYELEDLYYGLTGVRLK